MTVEVERQSVQPPSSLIPEGEHPIIYAAAQIRQIASNLTPYGSIYSTQEEPIVDLNGVSRHVALDTRGEFKTSVAGNKIDASQLVGYPHPDGSRSAWDIDVVVYGPSLLALAYRDLMQGAKAADDPQEIEKVVEALEKANAELDKAEAFSMEAMREMSGYPTIIRNVYSGPDQRELARFRAALNLFKSRPVEVRQAKQLAAKGRARLVGEGLADLTKAIVKMGLFNPLGTGTEPDHKWMAIRDVEEDTENFLSISHEGQTARWEVNTEGFVGERKFEKSVASPDVEKCPEHMLTLEESGRLTDGIIAGAVVGVFPEIYIEPVDTDQSS